MKWLFYVIVFVYMFYRAVYGGKVESKYGLVVEPVTFGDKHFLKAGEHKTISCKSSNKNQKVEWYYPNGSVVKRIPGSRVFAQDHFVQSLRGRSPALVLTITQATAMDTGVYQCRVGDLSKDVSLCVIDPSVFVDTPVELTSDAGRSITLSCQAKGGPEPRIVWSRNGENITDEDIEDSSTKYRVMTKYNIEGFEGLLTITSLTPEDSGVYSCIAVQESAEVEDCSYTQTFNITLNVNYAPVFEEGEEKNAYAKNNEQVKLTCSAPGFPLPTYRWFRELANDSLFEYDKKQIKLEEDENQAILTVTANSATFGQRYKCQATNELGTADQFFTLMRVEKPSRIDEITVVDSSDKAVQLNVTWFENIAFPVDAIQIQYIQDDNEGRRKHYSKDTAWRKSKQTEVELTDENEVRPDKGGTEITFEGLEKETFYWIRLRATNAAGESPWSEPLFILTSAEEPTTTTETSEEGGADAEPSEGDMNDSTFYGIFFAGGIFVVSFVCMLGMRMVK